MSNLRPRRVRSNAFDLTRQDRDDVDITPAPPPLGQLLARVTPQATPTEPAPTTETPRAAPPQPAQPAVGMHRDRPRGSGGRAASRGGTGRITATAARVPVEVYDKAEALVKGRGLPSWGQLVAWTCSTHQRDVVEEVVRLLRPIEGTLVPRGQNKRGAPATQITARFTMAEQRQFEQARHEAETAMAAAGAESRDVTATAVVTAALIVATRSPALGKR